MFANIFLTFAAGHSLEVPADGVRAAEQDKTVMLRDGNCFRQGTGAVLGAFCALQSLHSKMPLSRRMPVPCCQHLLYFNYSRT